VDRIDAIDQVSKTGFLRLRVFALPKLLMSCSTHSCMGVLFREFISHDVTLRSKPVGLQAEGRFSLQNKCIEIVKFWATTSSVGDTTG